MRNRGRKVKADLGITEVFSNSKEDVCELECCQKEVKRKEEEKEEEADIMPVNEEEEWQDLEVTVDSGAVDSVMNKDHVESVPTKTTSKTRRAVVCPPTMVAVFFHFLECLSNDH